MRKIDLLLTLWASVAATVSANRLSALDTLLHRSTSFYQEDAPESEDYLDSPDEPDDNDISDYDPQDLDFSSISEPELDEYYSEDAEIDNNNYNRVPEEL